MAKRPVFVSYDKEPHFIEREIEFTYCSGFAESQRRKSVNNLHNSYTLKYPNDKILEVSNFSESMLGKSLSAFNLLIELNTGVKVPVENAFQSSKVFDKAGPFPELLYCSPREAKKAECLTTSGCLREFKFQGEVFPLDPKTFFYDWLYISALKSNQKITDQLMQYNAFTDIVFNPSKSINCQARTVAIYVSLCRNGLINVALKNPDNFKRIVYGYEDESEVKETTLFDFIV